MAEQGLSQWEKRLHIHGTLHYIATSIVPMNITYPATATEKLINIWRCKPIKYIIIIVYWVWLIVIYTLGDKLQQNLNLKCRFQNVDRFYQNPGWRNHDLCKQGIQQKYTMFITHNVYIETMSFKKSYCTPHELWSQFAICRDLLRFDTDRFQGYSRTPRPSYSNPKNTIKHLYKATYHNTTLQWCDDDRYRLQMRR